ncbi:PilZ domain-containing protein [Novosphingobium resinovorum]|uniref:PilZ domain-containing protein n=1 Tax=Novosphingobium resinovorum TaxID=158500 RepID=UPI002ED68FFF|nr:PilZ domain-containing protein [Novosphingobium resinovorum]
MTQADNRQSDNRQIARDSLFLMADLRIDGLDGEFRIKVRNLSAGGMMGEGTVRVVRGTVVAVNIRNIGWVEGSVAWVQDSRFGVAFREDIDPRLARAQPDKVEHMTPDYLRNYAPPAADTTLLRKI